MKTVIQILFYLVSLAAAALWWLPAAVTVPVSTWAGIGAHGDFMDALSRSARLNALAAFCNRGISVLGFSAVSRVSQSFATPQETSKIAGSALQISGTTSVPCPGRVHCRHE
jgi:hypothetical protein